MHPDLDFAALIAKFEAQGFAPVPHNGVPIYTRSVTGFREQVRTSDMAILNTAIIPEDQLLVLASDIRLVQAALDVRANTQPALAASAPLQAVAQELGTIDSALLLTDPCSVLTISQRDESPQGPAVHPYAAFGLGYHVEDGRSKGLAVMHYADAALAEQDLAPRQERAINVPPPPPNSMVGNFTLEEATVRESTIMMRVLPFDNRSLTLFQSIESGDIYATYAACS